MSLFHPITHLFNHSSYTSPHYHPSILISSYVIIPSYHPSVQPFILHTTSLSPSILISSYVIIPSHHPSVQPFVLHTTSLSPSILISSYVIIPSRHPSVQPFILHTTSLSPIHSDIILCHYSIISPICSTIHPTHHLTTTHPF